MVRLGADARRRRRSAPRRSPTRCRRTRTRRSRRRRRSSSEIKLIDYDFAKYGSSAERKRLLSKWDKEVEAPAQVKLAPDVSVDGGAVTRADDRLVSLGWHRTIAVCRWYADGATRAGRRGWIGWLAPLGMTRSGGSATGGYRRFGAPASWTRCAALALPLALACWRCCWRSRSPDAAMARLLILAGAGGLALMLVQGFAVGLHGWSWPALAALFGRRRTEPGGMGYGALAAAVGLPRSCSATGSPQRGFCRGDRLRRRLRSALVVALDRGCSSSSRSSMMLASAVQDNEGVFAPASSSQLLRPLDLGPRLPRLEPALRRGVEHVFLAIAGRRSARPCSGSPSR